MYKVINVTDRDGNVKEEFMKELKAEHPDMCGVLLYPINKNLVNTFLTRLCLVWTDNSDRMLRTSSILDYSEQDNLIILTTVNSIYTLEKIK